MSATLWMGDLDLYMDTTFITAVFVGLGETNIKVKHIRNKFTGEPKGYCFVEFESEITAQKALARLNGHPIPGTNPVKRFKLNIAAHGSSYHSLEYNLYVGELTQDVDDYALHEFFAKRYYTCKTAKVVIDNYGVSRGFGFVRFFGEEDQKRALTEMNNVTGLGRKPIRVAIAPSKRDNLSYRRQGPTDKPPSAQQSYEQYYQHYQQQYQNYYRQAWGNYTDSRQQPSTQQPDQQQQLLPAGYDEQQAVQYQQDGNALAYYKEEDVEDPEVTVDVDKANAEFITQNDELFEAVEGSRWQPLDSITSEGLSLIVTS